MEKLSLRAARRRVHNSQGENLKRKVTDLQKFMGWPKLMVIIEYAETHPKTNFKDTYLFADLIAIAFATCGRINEVLTLTRQNFKLSEAFIEVNDMPLSKRWKKEDTTIECMRCHTMNEKFEAVCTKCGANLVFAGKKHYKTRKVEALRKSFRFPRSELTTPYVLRRLRVEHALLFQNPNTRKPISARCALTHLTEIGRKVRIPLGLWNHRFRSERLKQLVEEYHFNKEDLKQFSGIVEDSTLDMYAGTTEPYEKKMGLT